MDFRFYGEKVIPGGLLGQYAFMAKEFCLYAAQAQSNGWRVAKRISCELGEAMVSAGAANRVFDQFENHVGYKLVDPETHEASLPELTSSAAITARESEANAGLMGWSGTRHLREEQRLTRVHSHTGKQLPAEDFIERAQAKVAGQTSSANIATGDRATRIYPRAAKWGSGS